MGGEERQQEPPRSHFRFRSAPPSLPPPATPPPPPRAPRGSLRLPSAVETHTAGKQDGMASSLKCAAQTFASGPRIYPLARKRGRKKGGRDDDTVTTGVPRRIREVDQPRFRLLSSNEGTRAEDNRIIRCDNRMMMMMMMRDPRFFFFRSSRVMRSSIEKFCLVRLFCTRYERGRPSTNRPDKLTRKKKSLRTRGDQF